MSLAAADVGCCVPVSAVRWSTNSVSMSIVAIVTRFCWNSYQESESESERERERAREREREIEIRTLAITFDSIQDRPPR